MCEKVEIECGQREVLMLEERKGTADGRVGVAGLVALACVGVRCRAAATLARLADDYDQVFSLGTCRVCSSTVASRSALASSQAFFSQKLQIYGHCSCLLWHASICALLVVMSFENDLPPTIETVVRMSRNVLRSCFIWLM